MDDKYLLFRQQLQYPTLDLPRLALQFAQGVAYPTLDINAYLARLEDLARQAEQTIPAHGSTVEQAQALSHFLFHQAGFQGNSTAYDDPRNSYLNEVLDRRLGIPISLSVLYVAVARRLGLAAHGVGMPGHYIVSVTDGDEPLLLDTFHGGIPLSYHDCVRLVHMTVGYDVPFQDDWLYPTTERDTLARMLNNLRLNYMQRGAWSEAEAVLRYLRLVQPEQAEHLRDLGLVMYQNGRLTQALHHLEAYFATEPHQRDVEAIRQGLEPALNSWVRLN